MPPTNAETKVQDPKYKNWLSVSLALYYLKVGIISFIQREVDAMHHILLQKVSRLSGLSAAQCSHCTAMDVRQNRNTHDWRFRSPCPSSLCDAWLIELLRFHIEPKSSKICWGNCDVTAWPFKPWECAKLYMPQGQTTTNTGPDMSDSQALLFLMANCSYFHGKLSQAGLSLIHKVSKIRNRVMHSEHMELSDDDRKDFIDDIIQLLEDPTHLRSLKECQEAVDEINKINVDSVDVIFNHRLEMKAMRECVNDCRYQIGSLKSNTEVTMESLKMEFEELKAQIFKNQEPTGIIESGTSAMSFTLEDIKQAWKSIKTELEEELDPVNILSFFTFLSENECQVIRCKKKRREMVERFLLRIEENLPDAFYVLLRALEKTGKGSLVNTLKNIINGADHLQATAHVSNMSSIKVKVSVVSEDGSKSHNAEMKIKDDFKLGSSVFSSDLCSIVITVEPGSIIVHLRPVSKHAQETLEFFCKHGGMKDYILNLLRKKDLFASLPVGEVSVEVEVSCHKEGEAYADAHEPMEDYINENIEVVDNPQVIQENLLLQYGSLLEEIDPLNLQETFIGREILDTGFFQGLTHLRRRERAAEFLNEVLSIGSNALVGLAEALKSNGRENLATKLCSAVKKMPHFGDREQVDEALVQVVREDSQMHVDECVLWSCHIDLLIGSHAGDERETTVTEEIPTQGADKIVQRMKFNETADGDSYEEFEKCDKIYNFHWNMGQSVSKSSGESANIYKEVDNYQRNEERRIILIGKTGTGKSTLGNAILGDHVFKNEGVQMQSNTTYCQIGQKKGKDGKDIVVLDTPGLMDTKREQQKIFEELCKCTAMTAPGPHAFCLVIRGDDRFTQEYIDTLDEFCAFFGEEIYKYVIVVFTHKASMGKSTTIDDCISALPSEFLAKFLKFGGKKIAIESRAEKKQLKKQINDLFKMIEEIIEKNDGGYYSEEKFKAAEEAFRKRIPKIQQEVEKLFEGKKKSLEDEYQEKAKRFEERENVLAKKLKEEKEKFEQEKQSNEKEKLEEDAAQMKKLEAKHHEEMKSLEERLEKECKEKEKTKEEYERKMEEINKKVVDDLRTTIIKDRSKAREAVPESRGFSDVAKNAVKEGAGFAYDVVTGGIGSAIGAIGNWFFGDK